MKKYYVIKLNANNSLVSLSPNLIRTFWDKVLIEAESDTEAIEKAKKTYSDYAPFIVGIYEGN